jgi:pyruvate formate lyase activating enzyme
MTSGMVFDIKEFTVHDGPGVRTTVFLKGCPLACMWCHNPEGQSIQPQVIKSIFGERTAGREYSATELASLLNKQAEILRTNEGGITFSGGEPLFQAAFVAEVIDNLENLHVVLDTCGFGSSQDFLLLLSRSDLVFYDLKLIDREAHYHYTGHDNDLILNNLCTMSQSGKPYIIRVPLVPNVTDTDENLSAIARTVEKLPGLIEVDLLPYNRAAGAKYQSAGMEFKPEYDEGYPLNINLKIFEELGIKVKCA